MEIDYKELGFRIDKLSLLRRVTLGRIFQTYGLHFGQFPLLRYVIENDGCTQAEVAEFLGVSPASVALSTKRLSRAGMIEKSVDKDNLRRNTLKITSKGLEVANRCSQEFDEYNRRLFSGISSEERQILFDTLGKLLHNAFEGREPDMHTLMKDMKELKNNHCK